MDIQRELHVLNVPGLPYGYFEQVRSLVERLDKQLAARVEVVRCASCTHFTPYFADSECRMKSDGKCGLTMGTRPENHFCAWGERRKE